MIRKTVERLRAEFIEMPGLSLTREQVQRFCGVNERIVQAVLDSLVDAAFLRMRPDGSYARLTEGPSTLSRAGVPSSSADTTRRRRDYLLRQVVAMKRFFKWSAILASTAIGSVVWMRFRHADTNDRRWRRSQGSVAESAARLT
jgi:hypothetical protein